MTFLKAFSALVYSQNEKFDKISLSSWDNSNNYNEWSFIICSYPPVKNIYRIKFQMGVLHRIIASEINRNDRVCPILTEPRDLVTGKITLDQILSILSTLELLPCGMNTWGGTAPMHAKWIKLDLRLLITSSNCLFYSVITYTVHYRPSLTAFISYKKPK